MESLLACEACDQLHRHQPLARGEKASCQGCGTRLYGSSIDSLERTFALNLAAVALFVVANATLFLRVSKDEG